MPRFEPHPERRPTAVTGASSGIGAEAARALARAGHPVVLGARRVEVCEEVAASIRAEGGEAVACHLDLADPGSVTRFAKEADAAFGPVEILVSNAAKIQPGTALETSPEDFEEVLRVNIGGAQRLVRAFGAGMVERRRGDLIFVTSDVVAHPRPRMAAYVASKWGLEGFVTASADGAGRHGGARRDRAARPDLDGNGNGLGPRRHRRGAGRVDALGPGPALGLPAARGRGVRHRPRGGRAPGHASQRGGGPTRSTTHHGRSTVTTETTLREPPRVSGGEGENGHLDELSRDPIGLMARVRAECGDVGEFTLAARDVVLLTGADANEFYFRAPEEQLDQAEAYPFMTPIFGKGVVFDAPPERRREMLHNQALRDKFMRGHAATISHEVEQMVAGWDDEGEIDLLEWFAELTIYTSSACLIGPRFRSELDGRFARLYHDLEQGTDPIAYVDPYADIESFHRRERGTGGARRAGRRHHGAPGLRSAGAGRRGRPARHFDVDPRGGRLAAFHGRHRDGDVHLHDVRRSPHDLGHGGLDPH